MSGFSQLCLMLVMCLALNGCSAEESAETRAESTAAEAVTKAEATTTSETKEETTAAEAVQKELFSCYTLDQNGEGVNGFKRQEDGKWYLLVPSAQAIEELVLYFDYSEKVTEVSVGELDGERSIVVKPFAASGDQVELTAADGTVFTVVVMQSELPSVQIYLKDTTLDKIHLDKDEKFKGNTVVISDPEGSYNLTVEDSVEMKGRGNSTWRLYDKKGYQIKFDEKTSVLGMGKAKKWVLLANASDDSMIRTQLVYRMAEKLEMDFVPDFRYVDFWVDGDYLGTYMIGEKVEIGGSRLELEAGTGALFEHDEAFYSEEDYWIYSTMLQRHFVLKEISEEEEAFIIAAMDDFGAAVDELALYLYRTPSKTVTLEALAAMIDVDSFAKYYLVNEYVLNQESFATSFYWYKDGPEDVIHLGPIWDFDTCMGNDGAAYTESYGDSHILFSYLLAIPEFRARTEELYQQYRSEFAGMTADVKVLKETIGDSAAMNYLRWDVLGQENPKEPGEKFHDTFEDAVLAVEMWLTGRMEHFRIPESVVVNSQVSQDCSSMKVAFDDGEAHTSVRFAVWNLESNEGMVQWYDAEQVDGVWKSTVNLTSFGAAGMYQIDAYCDGEKEARATGRNYAETAAESAYQLEIQLSGDKKIMTITLRDREPCENVSLAVWSSVDAQDDLQWFQAVRNSEGLWEYSADMALFQSTGEYCIDAYENQDGTMVKLNAATINVE